MKNKRGISPLLATVLLVALTVTIAALVSNFLLSKAKSFDPSVIAEQSVFCDEVSLGYTVPDPAQLSIVTKIVGGLDYSFFENLTIVNRGAFSIQQFIITAPGKASRNYPILDPNYRVTNLKPGIDNKYNLSVQLIKNTGTNIIIVPVIRDTEKNQLVKCVDRQLIINYSQLCTEIGKSPAC